MVASYSTHEGTNSSPTGGLRPQDLVYINTATMNKRLEAGELNAVLDTPRKQKKKGKQKTIEQILAEPIRLGLVKVTRRKGKPPLITWL